MKKPGRISELMSLTGGIKPNSSPKPEKGEQRDPRTAPGQFMNSMTGRDAAEERAREAEEKLAQFIASRRAKFSELVEVPGRRRYKSPEEKAELRANMLREGLIHNLTVAARPEGGYEIVGGHHRRDFAEEFYKEGIAGWPDDVGIDIVDSEGAHRKAFYSNLFHSSLPDFEKWEGLKRLAVDNKLETYEAQAEFTGMAVSTIKKLAKFDGLPEEAQALLSQKKDAIGANAAEKLAKLAKEGKGDAVTAAIKSIIEDPMLTQDKAVQMAQQADKPAKAIATPIEPIVFRSGRNNYCKMIPTGSTIRIDFTNEANRAEAEKIIGEALERLAQLNK